MNTFSKYILTFLIFFSCTFLKAQSFITTQKGDNAIVLKEKSSQLSFLVSNGTDSGVLRAISNLQSDFEKVTGEKPSILNQKPNIASPLIIIGTIGTNSAIDDLVKANKIDGKLLKGKNEKYTFFPRSSLIGLPGRNLKIPRATSIRSFCPIVSRLLTGVGGIITPEASCAHVEKEIRTADKLTRLRIHPVVKISCRGDFHGKSSMAF